MTISRRGFLKLGAAGVGALALPIGIGPAKAEAGDRADSRAMLYDATMCVGCRACSRACKTRAKLPEEADSQGLYEKPAGLSSKTWTVIKVYQGQDGASFVKNQCMHCIDPACVSVCPVAALQKLENGPVVYHADRCIGCRYCMAACPFGIPKTEWEKPFPLIQKCDFCADRQADGLEPACGAACPTGALISGTRREMLDTAHARLKENPKYIQHVYGETEAGGTSMLYLANIKYQELGFPELDDTPLPTLDWPYLKGVPALIAVMVSLSTAIYLYTHRGEKVEKGKEA